MHVSRLHAVLPFSLEAIKGNIQSASGFSFRHKFQISRKYINAEYSYIMNEHRPSVRVRKGHVKAGADYQNKSPREKTLLLFSQSSSTIYMR